MKSPILPLLLIALTAPPVLHAQTAPSAPRHAGPPPAAYTACQGKGAGDRAQFTNPGGGTVEGECGASPEGLVLRPDRGPEGERNGPPPEAYAACEGKAAGAEAEIAAPSGETLRGRCERDGERMVLRPDCNRRTTETTPSTEQ